MPFFRRKRFGRTRRYRKRTNYVSFQRVRSRWLNNTRMFKSPRPIMPQNFTTTLRWSYFTSAVPTTTSQLVINATSNAYDVDPLLGGAAMPGFASFAAFYDRFRTIRFGYKLQIVNQDDFGINYIGFLSNQNINTLPGTATSSSGNPNCKLITVAGANGMNKGILKHNRSINDIVGTRTAMYDDRYTGGTTTGMLAPGWLYLSIWQDSPVVPVNGSILTVTISLTVTFYRPIVQAV